VSALAGPFEGQSIIDLEVLRVQAEDELAAVRHTRPDSPSIPGLEQHLALVTDEIAARGLLGA
jgi:hypothetical protein